MTIENKTTNTSSVLPITWNWIAGFFQAEGSVDLIDDKGHLRPKVSIGLKDELTIKNISAFINTEFSSESAHAYKDIRGFDQLRLNDKNTSVFLTNICRSMYGKKRAEVFECLQKPDDRDTLPLQWEFLAGFYEGDGSTSITYNQCRIQFAQKDPTILYAIKEFFSKGCIHQHSSQTNFGYDSGFVLTITDSIKHLNIVKELLIHLRTQQKRHKLISVMTTFGVSQ